MYLGPLRGGAPSRPARRGLGEQIVEAQFERARRRDFQPAMTRDRFRHGACIEDAAAVGDAIDEAERRRMSVTATASGGRESRGPQTPILRPPTP